MARRSKGATRHAAKSEAVRSRRGWVLPLVIIPSLLSALFWGAATLFDPETLPITTVRVENELKYLGRETVRRTVLTYVREGFLRVDVEAIRKELEMLPWVAEASVRRGWPDVLSIRLREQQASARWREGGLVNPDGELFAVEDTTSWQHLPVLHGPKQTEKILMKEYLAMQGVLTPLGLHISRLSMDRRRAWSMRLDNGLRLRLGRNNSHKRLLRFVRVYPTVLQPRLETIDSVDLRYTNGFAVSWREGSTAA